jgi:hypothetical protein
MWYIHVFPFEEFKISKLPIVLHAIMLSYDLAMCGGMVQVSNDNEYSR